MALCFEVEAYTAAVCPRSTAVSTLLIGTDTVLCDMRTLHCGLLLVYNLQ
jgi:hypothetical protein